jgi:hypothetical protein
MASSSASLRLRSGQDLGLETVAEVKSKIRSAIEAKS